MVDNPKKTDNVKCIEFLKLIFSHIRIPDWWLSPSITSRGGRMPTMENTNLRKTSDLESEGLLVFRIFLVEFSSGFNQPGTSRSFQTSRSPPMLNGADTDWHRLFMFLGVRWCVFSCGRRCLFSISRCTPVFWNKGNVFCWDRTKTFFVLSSNLDAPRLWFKPRKKDGIFATDHKGPKTDPSQGSSPDSPVCFLLGSGTDSAFFSRPLGGPCLMLSDAIAKAPKPPWILSQLVSWHFGVLHQSQRECCPTQSNHFLAENGNSELRRTGSWDCVRRFFDILL